MLRVSSGDSLFLSMLSISSLSPENQPYEELNAPERCGGWSRERLVAVADSISSMASLSSSSVLTQRFSPVPKSFKLSDRRSHRFEHTARRVSLSSALELASQETTLSGQPIGALDHIMKNYLRPDFPDLPIYRFLVADIDPATAKLAISILSPFLSAFASLFVLRIVMSWYPKLPVGKFPYVIAYAPTEPILIPTRKLIPPLGGVDVTPVVWFGLVSFMNEILLGPQGLLVLVSQQVS